MVMRKLNFLVKVRNTPSLKLPVFARTIESGKRKAELLKKKSVFFGKGKIQKYGYELLSDDSIKRFKV